MLFHPTSGLGQIQSEVADVRRMVRSKVESYEVHSLNSKVDRLEHSLLEINSALDGIRYRIEELEREKING